MRLEHDDGQVGADGNDHQRQEEVVAARQLGDEEDARQRGVHHTAHHARHTHEGKILLRQERSRVKLIAEVGKDKTRDAPQIERGGKDTAATASAIGRAGSKDLEEDDQHQVEQQQVAVTVEQGVIHHRVPLVIAHPVQQQFYRIIAFAIKRRKKENQNAQHGAAQQELLPRRVQPAKDALHPAHGPCEVERHQAAKDAQQDDVGDAPQGKRLVEVEAEHGFLPRDDVGQSGRRDRRNEQR